MTRYVDNALVRSHAGRGLLLQQLRVMVVDGDPDTANAQVRVLEDLGQRAGCAYSGQTALGLACELRPQVVLLAMQLNDMNAFQMTRQLRQMPWMRRARIIGQCEKPDEEGLERALAAGMDALIRRPPPVEQMIGLLQRQGPRSAMWF